MPLRPIPRAALQASIRRWHRIPTVQTPHLSAAIRRRPRLMRSRRPRRRPACHARATVARCPAAAGPAIRPRTRTDGRRGRHRPAMAAATEARRLVTIQLRPRPPMVPAPRRVTVRVPRRTTIQQLRPRATAPGQQATARARLPVGGTGAASYGAPSAGASMAPGGAPRSTSDGDDRHGGASGFGGDARRHGCRRPWRGRRPSARQQSLYAGRRVGLQPHIDQFNRIAHDIVSVHRRGPGGQRFGHGALSAGQHTAHLQHDVPAKRQQPLDCLLGQHVGNQLGRDFDELQRDGLALSVRAIVAAG